VNVFFRRYGWLYLPGLLFLALSSYLQTLIPHYLGRIIDDLSSMIKASAGPAAGAALNPGNLIAMVLAALAVFVSRFIWRYLIMGNSRYLENCLRRQLFDHLLVLTPRFYQQQKTGDLMAYAVNDIGAIRQTLGPGLALSANAIIMSLLSIRSMSGEVNAQLTWLALLPIPPILVLILLFGRQVRVRFHKVQATFSAVSDRIQESITGIQVIKAYGLEQDEVKRFENLNLQSRNAQMRMTAVSAATSPLTTLLFGISFTIGLIQGAQLVMNGVISLGDFVAFQGYLALIVSPVQSVARIINLLQKGNASWKRFKRIMNVVPDVQEDPQGLTEDQLPERSGGQLTITPGRHTRPCRMFRWTCGPASGSASSARREAAKRR
jgi:ATP-binding cassette, subfamily B, multidrug efflux pump